MISMSRKKGLTRREAITLGIAVPLALALPQTVGGAIPGLKAIATMNWETRALWLKATLGDAEAMGGLALSYEWGDGVPEDEGRGIHWLKRAAESGDSWAQAWLGVKYKEGWMVPRNPTLARYLFRKAAAKGEEIAISELKGRA